MKDIKIDFPLSLLFLRYYTNSFYDDILPNSMIEATGYVQAHYFKEIEEEKLNCSQEKGKSRILKK